MTPAGVPGAPTIGTATAGNAQATLTFTAPASNGGSAITGYTVTSSPGGISANGAASPITVTGLTNGTAYTFTVTATNTAGTGPASAPSNSVTFVPPAASSIWPATAAPLMTDIGPDKAVELGVKFRSDSNGYITGIRFYKARTNTGTHVGNLWTSSGKLLAKATFTNETASGWQQVNFSTPVAITANTVYVASYHTNVGHYSDDQNFFASAGVDNPPLHALKNGVSGANGVYLYSNSSGFPNNSYKTSNYWVDVAFRLH